MHCAVTLAQTEELRLRDAAIGLRLHLRRGLELALLAALVVGSGVIAIRFYSGRGAWPLYVLIGDVLVVFAVMQVALWPLAVHEAERPFRAVLRQAVLVLLRRPVGIIGLTFALVLVNAAGLAAAIMPFLTLTIAYSFLAAAHFVLPRSPVREGVLEEGRASESPARASSLT